MISSKIQILVQGQAKFIIFLNYFMHLVYLTFSSPKILKGIGNTLSEISEQL